MPVELAGHIHLIDTRALGVNGVVSAYLVIGQKSALVDTGYASSVDAVIRAVDEAGVSASELDFIIPTHVHLDHAGAVGHLAKIARQARVIVHERGGRYLADPTRLLESAERIFGPKRIRRYGGMLSTPAERIFKVGESHRLDLGGGVVLSMFWAPGHAPHQIAILEERSGLLLTADSIGLHQTGTSAVVPTTPPPSFDALVAKETMEHIKKLQPKGLLTPHFGEVHEADAFVARNVREMDSWQEIIVKLAKAGKTREEIEQHMTSYVIEALGFSGDLPDHLLVSISVSVLGFLDFLSRSKGL